MNKNTEFPFAKARRITPEEINQAEIAIKRQFGEQYLIRENSPSYELVSLKLDSKIINWAKEQAKKQNIDYQLFINHELLKLSSSN